MPTNALAVHSPKVTLALDRAANGVVDMPADFVIWTTLSAAAAAAVACLPPLRSVFRCLRARRRAKFRDGLGDEERVVGG